MSITLEGGCRVSEMREGESLCAGTLRIWNRIGRATGAQAISLRVLEFAPGLSPGMRNKECDEILYVLNGPGGTANDGVSTACENRRIIAFINGHSYDLSRDTGIYISPGEIFAIDNPGPDPIVLVSAQCPDPDRPDREPQFVAPLTSPSSDSQPPASPLVRLGDQRAQSTADRWYRVLVDDEVGSTQVTQFVGSIPPGRAPDHFHHYEEVLVILKGEGRMWAGETNTPIAPGACIYLPKGQVHCVENTGTGELRLLGVFYPAGSPSVRYNV
jgi:mannose-6-phosphate isomerase-like protein (cupin superfamily)